MSGINAIFHLGSALAAILLVALLLGMKRQRDMLRRVVLERHQDAATRRVVVESPRVYLRALAKALDVSFEDLGGASVPARLDTEPVLELFFKHGLTLIRCQDHAIELHVAKPVSPGAVPIDRLAKALGGQVQVKVLSRS